MLYYIVRVWPNGDEDVVSSHDSLRGAVDMWKICVNANTTDAWLRIDSVNEGR